MLQVVPLNEIMMPKAMHLLLQFGESSLFLLNNLREHGPRRSQHPNSGNFRCVVDANDAVHAVFCLANRGTLLAHGDSLEDYTSLIVQDLTDNSIPLKGFIGPWEMIAPLSKAYGTLHPEFVPTLSRREAMMTANLTGRIILPNHPSVRLLTPQDFSDWLAVHTLYLEEEVIPQNISIEQQQKLFKERCQKKHWWGSFDGTQLTGIASLNAHFESLAQIGSVFTMPSHRRKGVAKAIINRVISDVSLIHRVTSISVFTSEENTPAQKLYAGLGFKHAGIFGMILTG